MKSINKCVASTLICCLLISCSASTHLGVVTVPTPAMTELNAEQWFFYYQDQFDAYKGKVDKPTDAYPPQAFRGYEKAEKEWNERVNSAKLKNTIAGIVVILVIYSILDFELGSFELNIGN